MTISEFPALTLYSPNHLYHRIALASDRFGNTLRPPRPRHAFQRAFPPCLATPISPPIPRSVHGSTKARYPLSLPGRPYPNGCLPMGPCNDDSGSPRGPMLRREDQVLQMQISKQHKFLLITISHRTTGQCTEILVDQSPKPPPTAGNHPSSRTAQMSSSSIPANDQVVIKSSTDQSQLTSPFIPFDTIATLTFDVRPTLLDFATALVVIHQHASSYHPVDHQCYCSLIRSGACFQRPSILGFEKGTVGTIVECMLPSL